MDEREALVALLRHAQPKRPWRAIAEGSSPEPTVRTY
jgi:hypothetical protein